MSGPEPEKGEVNVKQSKDIGIHSACDGYVNFIQREDHEVIEIKPGTSHMIACCDCGLVHEMAVAIENNGNVGLAFRRDEEETQKRRET